jgi:hypothetical protein
VIASIVTAKPLHARAERPESRRDFRAAAVDGGLIGAWGLQPRKRLDVRDNVIEMELAVFTQRVHDAHL